MTTEQTLNPRTRDELRAAIFSAQNTLRKTVIIQMFDVDVEVRQPSLKELQAMATDKTGQAIAMGLVTYCYVPGTNDHLFTKEDADAIMDLPAGPWLEQFNKAMESLTGIKLREAEKNSEGTELDSPS